MPCARETSPSPPKTATAEPDGRSHVLRFSPKEQSLENLKSYAIVRAPGLEVERCDLGFTERIPIDLGRAQAQHAQFCEALQALGVTVIELQSSSEHPNSCLVRDAAVLLDDPRDPVVIPAKSPLYSRQGEASAVLRCLPEHFRVLPMRDYDRFEGGDVVQWGERSLVGWSPRTNHGAHRELQRIIRMRHLRSESLPVRRANHLNSVLAGLDDESVLVSPLFLDTLRAEEYELIPIEEGELFCANMLPVAGVHLVDDIGPKTRRMLESLGHAIQVLDLSEFRKMEAGASDLALLFHSTLPPRSQAFPTIPSEP